MQEGERNRLAKMGTSSSLQTDTLQQSRRKRSFSLPRFGRSSAGERQEAARSAEEAARVQKAAAWQWYTRGVGEAVLPTKRPLVGNSQVPFDDTTVVDGIGKGGANIRNVLQKKPLEPPLGAESPRVSSRFKAEASFARPTSAGAQSAPSAAPSTPLYDELELSGLRTQMADFVQRLQRQQTKNNEHSAAVADHRKSIPLQHSAVDGRPLPVSTDHGHTKAPPPAAAHHQLTKPPPSAAPVASTIPLHMRPFSALHRLFRKVVSMSIIKSAKNSPLMIYEPEVLIPEEEEENSQYHYHHYIHHHHHHYHYGESLEESSRIIRSRRRHSESSGIRSHIPSPWEAESDEEEEEVERSPIEAYLARRRRHSDNFGGRHLIAKKAAFDEEEEMKGEAALPLQLPRRYNSERFSPNKIPTMDSKDPGAGSTEEFDEELLDVKSRRHSTEGAALERKTGGGQSGGGAYKLGGAADGAKPAKPLVRRRHSEVLQRPEGDHYEMGKRTPSPGRPYSHSRYLEDVLERQAGDSAPASSAAPAPRPRPRPPRDLPPIYPPVAVVA